MKKLFTVLGITTITVFCLPMIISSAIKELNLEKKSIYFPTKEILPIEKKLLDKTEIKSFINKEGLAITFWEIKGNKDLPVIVYCHGNSDNVSHFQKKLIFLAEKGHPIFLLDYRGYGQSDGTPDEKGLYADTESFLKHLEKDYNLATDQIVIWGHSLGGAVVTQIASNHRFNGVILDSTFTNMEDMKFYGASFKEKNKVIIHFKRFLYKFMPLSQKFQSSAKISKITSPLLIVHSKTDEVIPVGMAYRMNKYNPKSTLYISEYGLHDDIDWQREAVLDFLKLNK